MLRGARQLAARAARAGARRAAARLRRLRDHLPRAVLDRRLRARRSGARRGADGDLLRLRSGTASRSRGRSRSATNASGPSRTKHQAAASAKSVLSRVDLFARAERRSSVSEIARATADRASTATASRSSGRARPGQSMFVVASGSVDVVLEPERQEVAGIDAGGYFGEMSLLTGEPRTATVTGGRRHGGARARRRGVPPPGAPTTLRRSSRWRWLPSPGGSSSIRRAARSRRRRARAVRDTTRSDAPVPADRLNEKRAMPVGMALEWQTVVLPPAQRT